MGQPRPLFHLFSSFQTNITIFTANKCEKYPSSIHCRDSNSRPLEQESPPITTRPGLPPILIQQLSSTLGSMILSTSEGATKVVLHS